MDIDHTKKQLLLGTGLDLARGFSGLLMYRCLAPSVNNLNIPSSSKGYEEGTLDTVSVLRHTTTQIGTHDGQCGDNHTCYQKIVSNDSFFTSNNLFSEISPSSRVMR
jgi:hypothetical protein